MDKFFMHPYCEIDGGWTFSDESIRSLYRRMIEDGTANAVFMGSGVADESQFLNMAQSEGTHLYVLLVKGLPAGILWINRAQYRWAQLHYCTFREFWGKTTIELGRWANKKLITMKDDEGNYLLDMLVGILPARNRLAVRHAQACYGIITGELPKGVHNPVTGESEKAYIITLTREGIDDED